jgi:hypothetical protein
MKNANQSQVGIAIGLFITIENRSATGGRILDPIWELEVGGVTEDGLDASEMFSALGTETGTGCVKVYLPVIPCLVRLAFILSGVRSRYRY